MRAVDVIIEKRDGRELSPAAIDGFVRGVVSGEWRDYQASALLMAIVLRGMSADETWALTRAMLGSGDTVDLSSVPGAKVGKHSTGGVGDKVSIALAPVVAACGAIVPKMSGRGLGHTGGTLDKLESIPGFRVDLTIDEFRAALRDVGTAIIGQTAALVPADRVLYALRDVTGTVESLALMSASIMSKKLAEGSESLVLDVKVGDGAFMKDAERARALASAMVAIGARAGVRTEGVLTSMEAPLGTAVGNALEIAECVDVLSGRGPADVEALVRELGARMLVTSGVASDEAAAAAAVARALASGVALDRFVRLVERQGGDPRIVDDPSRLPQAPGRVVVTAPRAGCVHRVAASAIGRASVALGAGREKVGDSVDPAVGILVHVKPGTRVGRGDALAEICHRDGRGLDDARGLCAAAFAIDDAPVDAAPLIIGRVRSGA